MGFYKVIIIDDSAEKYLIEFYKREYENLEELIKNRLFIDFQNSEGWAIYQVLSTELTAENTLQKADKYKGKTLRESVNFATQSQLVACQIMVDEHINGKVFKIVKE